MLASRTFWALVRHEFGFKGNWRKRNRAISGWWKLVYCLLVVTAALGTATYFAYRGGLDLNRLWYATSGLPYMLIFVGVASMKRELDNDTQGWWLTLPYPRSWLASAKWLGSCLRLAAITGGLLLIAGIYGTGIALALPAYTFADIGDFLLAGIRWLAAVALFGPLVLVLGQLLITVQMTTWRPIAPVFWVLILGGGGLSISLLASYMDDNAAGFSAGMLQGGWFSYPWQTAAAVLVAWLLAIAIIRLIAYLLSRKLSL